jgi:hypothetical protein
VEVEVDIEEAEYHRLLAAATNSLTSAEMTGGVASGGQSRGGKERDTKCGVLVMSTNTLGAFAHSRKSIVSTPTCSSSSSSSKTSAASAASAACRRRLPDKDLLQGEDVEVKVRGQVRGQVRGHFDGQQARGKVDGQELDGALLEPRLVLLEPRPAFLEPRPAFSGTSVYLLYQYKSTNTDA